MRLNVHVIMGLNEDSAGLAKYLKQRYETVYILDHIVKGLHVRKDYTYVDEAFVHALDPTIFKVHIYEPPYKRPQILRRSKVFTLRSANRQDDVGHEK